MHSLFGTILGGLLLCIEFDLMHCEALIKLLITLGGTLLISIPMLKKWAVTSQNFNEQV